MLTRAIAARLQAAGRLLVVAESLPAVLPGPAVSTALPCSAFHAVPCCPLPEARAAEGIKAAAEAVGARLASAAESLKPSAAQSDASAAQQSTQQAEDKLLVDSLDPDEFGQLADVYLGGLWTRLERGLRQAEGEEFDYEVKPERGAMLVLLPYDGKLVIRKDCQGRALVVENNLYEPFEDKDSREFKPTDEAHWVDEEGQDLTEFVSDALGKYLRVEVKL